MAWLSQKVRTCLWFESDGDAAAAFYASLLPGGSIEGRHGPEDGPSLVIEFTIADAPMMILNAAGGPGPSHAASISVLTEDQAETDALWRKLLADGGKEVFCGWLTDRWGVSWQIIPRRLPEMLSSQDREARDRAFAAMQTMIKIDLDALEAAFAGK